MNKKIAAGVALAMLVGCAAPPIGSEPPVVDAGPEPTQADAEQTLREYLTSVLKDPDSLKQFEIYDGPRQIAWYRGLVNGGGHDKGWMVCFRYNAKNSYGGYVGVKQDGLVLRKFGDSFRVVQPVNGILADKHC